MNFDLNDILNWPDWTRALGWSTATLGVSWVTGRLVAAALGSRGRRSPVVRQHKWLADAVTRLGRRLPRWCLAVGVWVAAGYWPLTANLHALVGQAAFVFVAASMTLLAASIVAGIVEGYGAILAPSMPVNSLTKNIAWALTATVGALVVLNGLGLSVAPMLAALGVGGLAVALALQEPLANFFAGVFITLAGQIRVGDYVKLDSGQEGYVADFSWRSTRLRMLANNLVIVPNAKLAQAIVVNHHLPSQDLAVLVEIGVDYASDLGRVERAVMEVGHEVMTDVAGGVPDFQPFIRFHTFADSSVNFTVILRARQFVDQYLVKHEFVKRIHERFDQDGIVIPFPIRTLIQRQSASTEGAGPARPSTALPW